MASVDFNGTTAKAEHTTADVLNGVQAVTLCVWTNADGQGGGSLGRVLMLDEAEGNALWGVYHDNSAGVLRVHKFPGAAGTQGIWTFPATDGQWNAIAVRHDFSGDNAPTVRVNFAAATVTPTSAPSGIQDLPASGYCVGNRANQQRGWDGKIAYVQVFNAILSDADSDRALLRPGSVTSGLRLYLKLTSSTDVTDQSGNGFDATPTDLATYTPGPNVYPMFPQVLVA